MRRRVDQPEQLHPVPGWASALGLGVGWSVARPRPGSSAAGRELIAERVARYAWAFDERDRSLLGDCFTAEAIWEGSVMGRDQLGPVTGREAIVDYLAGFWAAQDDQRRHMFTNVVTSELTADRAVSHAYLLLTAARDGRLSIATAGVYRFALSSDSGDWRIHHLACGFDVPSS
jgi:hypothetical protein